jgi:capsid protein
MPAPSTALKTARKERDAAIEVARKATRHARKVKAEYDVLKSNKLRRTPRTERKDEGGIYTMQKRLFGTNIGRDLERNCSVPKGMLHQFRSNVVGSLGKMKLNIEGGDEAAKWFNEVWAKAPDFRDDTHWSTMLQNLGAAVLREGDLLTVFDDGIIDDSGKLLTWESDQIGPVEKDALAKMMGGAYKDATQDNGILRDKWGRIVAYITSGKRGRSVYDVDDVTVFPRGAARLLKNPWRLNQGRGIPSIVSAAASFLDLYEMLLRELQTAKRAAAQYAMVKRKDAVDDWDNPGTHPEYLPENDGKTATEVAAEGANSATNPEARNYEALEEALGGFVDYGVPEDEIDYAPAERPNVHMPEFIEAVHCQAGMVFGLARAYALLKADTSYTAFRGDMIMTWQGAFYPMQKWLERQAADWIGVKALAWGQRHKEFKELPAGWDRNISWTWPIMPEVNPLVAQNAIAQKLKNGATDYSEILGPDWKNILKGFADQVEWVRELVLPLGILETKSGGQANSSKGAA